MAKKIEQTPDEAILYRDLQKLVKRANQRLLRIERETGEKGTFAAKQLYDYLGSSELNAITQTGRISIRKSYNMTQMQAIKKATEQYLKEPTSTVRGVKRYKEKVSKESGKPLDYNQANTIYQARKDFWWIYDYLTPSEFWAIANTCKEANWSVEKFIDEISSYIGDVNDEDLRFSLIELYNYVMSGV